jgi:alpha-D-ribose 1-methylphosphonate 5-triphosphate diphosphatase
VVEQPLVQLASLMNHSPGQRQFAKEEKYREYYMGKYHLSTAEMEASILEQMANSREFSDRHRQAIAADCHARGLALASHDDATLAHVRNRRGSACPPPSSRLPWRPPRAAMRWA